MYVALPFQLGHLRTAFRLLDKDQDGLVSVEDLRFHYQSQGCEISRCSGRGVWEASLVYGLEVESVLGGVH